MLQHQLEQNALAQSFRQAYWESSQRGHREVQQLAQPAPSSGVCQQLANDMNLQRGPMDNTMTPLLPLSDPAINFNLAQQIPMPISSQLVALLQRSWYAQLQAATGDSNQAFMHPLAMSGIPGVNYQTLGGMANAAVNLQLLALAQQRSAVAPFMPSYNPAHAFAVAQADWSGDALLGNVPPQMLLAASTWTSATESTIPGAAAAVPIAMAPAVQSPLDKADMDRLFIKNKELRKKAFPIRLHRLLTDASEQGFEEIISWSPSGRAFKLKDRDRFQYEVMPKYFRMSKISSFRRQLSMYGFTRLFTGLDKGSYKHELFLKDHPELACHMRRVTEQREEDALQEAAAAAEDAHESENE
ncbi:hypothetical protein MPSEU_000449800 [Mayamaea pseudoterrestris]|nr:hypothetical protein MPSEU_000449800 [Mayamaea pseudoterrestris]